MEELLEVQLIEPVISHTHVPNTEKLRQKDHQELKASLDYTVSRRPVLVSDYDPVSKNESRNRAPGPGKMAQW